MRMPVASVPGPASGTYGRSETWDSPAANLGARHARGEYLVFLNNDTEVEPGWLEALLDAARSGPEVGAVGAMLVSPDRLLQEAGGVIWSDATGLNYGRGSDPNQPEFLYRRGSRLLLRRLSDGRAATLRVGRRIRRVLRSWLLRGHRPVFHPPIEGPGRPSTSPAPGSSTSKG